MNKKMFFVLALIGLFLTLPLINSVESLTVIDESHSVTPYLLATVDVFYKAKSTTALGAQGSSVEKVTLQIEAGFIPLPEKAVSVAKIRSIGGLYAMSNETSTETEIKTDAEKFSVDSTIDFLHPVEEIDIIQSNASWTSINEMDSDGLHYMLLIKTSSNITIKQIFIDYDSNHTNGYTVLLNSTSGIKTNLYWMPIPYGNWSYVYIVTNAATVPSVRFLKNAIAVRDYRHFDSENVEITTSTPEELESSDETQNIFIGVKNLHEYIFDIIKEYMEEHYGTETVYGYNVSSAKFSLKIGKYVEYKTAASMSFALMSFEDINSFFDRVTVTIGTSLNQIEDVIEHTVSTTTDAMTSTVTEFVKKAEDLGAEYVKFDTSVIDNIASALSDVGASVQTIAQATVNNIGKYIAQATNATVDFGAKMLEAVSIGVGDAVGYVVQFTNNVFGAVTSFVQKAKWIIITCIIIAVVVIITLLTYPLWSKRRGKGGF